MDDTERVALGPDGLLARAEHPMSTAEHPVNQWSA